MSKACQYIPLQHTFPKLLACQSFFFTNVICPDPLVLPCPQWRWRRAGLHPCGYWPRQHEGLSAGHAPWLPTGHPWRKWLGGWRGHVLYCEPQRLIKWSETAYLWKENAPQTLAHWFFLLSVCWKGYYYFFFSAWPGQAGPSVHLKLGY